MTPERLRKELARSLKRRGLEVPKTPYHAERLYPHSGRWIPPVDPGPAPRKRLPTHRATCVDCGARIRTTQTPEDARCRTCWVKTVRSA